MSRAPQVMGMIGAAGNVAITIAGHTSQLSETVAWFCAFAWAFVAFVAEKERK